MRKKLILGFGVLMALVVLVGAMSLYSINRVSKSWESAEKDGLGLVNNAEDCFIGFLACRKGEKDFLLRNKKEGAEAARERYIQKEFAPGLQACMDSVKKIKDLKGRIEELKGIEVEKLEMQLGEYSQDVYRMVDAILKSPNADQESFISENSMQVASARAIKEILANMRQEGDRLAALHTGEAHAAEAKSMFVTVVFVAIALVIGAVLVVVVMRIVNRSIKLLTDAVNQITSAGNEILAAAQEQASGAREQSSAVAETTSAAKELSITSEQVGDSIKRVSLAATHAMAGMAKIKEAIGKTNAMITSLGEKSQQIGKITDLIDDVADQTNLLAVNASIEAARAGEQGRGFTVVADEIRKLADSTAKSTKDITALIEIIQHEMTNSIMSMETSVTSIDDEAKLASETADSAKEIAMSTSQQISGSKQIADAMLNIDEAMKQIAVGAQQSQAAVKQLTDLAVGLKKLTQTLE